LSKEFSAVIPRVQLQFRTFVFGVAVILVAARMWYKGVEEPVIRSRYAQLYAALRDDPAEAKRMFVLYPSDHLDSALDRVSAQAHPIGPQFHIDVGLGRAWVRPLGEQRFLILRGGNAIELRKLNGEWYFTGKVSID
jgi:hypothetical protein